nr:EH domain-binding protein 1-like isoform X2 [Procambarus clarkii]
MPCASPPARDEDMQSMASLMSMNTPNDIAPLEDFDDEDENEGDAMVRSAEFSQLAAQISSLTSSFHQDDPLSFSFSDSLVVAGYPLDLPSPDFGHLPPDSAHSPPHSPYTPTPTPTPLQDSPLNAFDEKEEDAATLEGGEEHANAISTEGHPPATSHNHQSCEGDAAGASEAVATTTSTAPPASDPAYTSVHEG